MSRWITQQKLDQWLPTIARYLGLLLTLALTGALILGHTEVTPGFVPAAGLLLYKSVRDAVSANEDPPK